MENSMYKRRRLNRPTIPQDAEEAITLLNDCSDEFTTYILFSTSRCNVLCCSKTIPSAS